jgi:hypothetical protein
VATREELDALSSKELHDRAFSAAKRHADVGFFWNLLKAIPAAEVAAGEEAEAEQDVMSMRGHLNDLTNSGEGELADALRPLYIEYLLKRS